MRVNLLERTQAAQQSVVLASVESGFKRELVIDGTVSLHLAKPKEIDSITVRLRNEARLHAAGLNFNEVLFEREQTFTIENKLFQAGVHTFEFAFSVPVSQRLQATD